MKKKDPRLKFYTVYIVLIKIWANRFLLLVVSLIWTVQVGAEGRICRQFGPRCQKWFGWNQAMWAGANKPLYMMCLLLQACSVEGDMAGCKDLMQHWRGL